MDFNSENLAISVVQKNRSANQVLMGSDYLFMEVLGRRFRVSAPSFFQINIAQANAMVQHILAYLPLTNAMTVVDAYCGVGLFSAFLAPKVKKLLGVELSPEACDDLTTNLDEFDQVSLYVASAEEVFCNINFNPEVIIMAPPREGI